MYFWLEWSGHGKKYNSIWKKKSWIVASRQEIIEQHFIASDAKMMFRINRNEWHKAEQMIVISFNVAEVLDPIYSVDVARFKPNFLLPYIAHVSKTRKSLNQHMESFDPNVFFSSFRFLLLHSRSVLARKIRGQWGELMSSICDFLWMGFVRNSSVFLFTFPNGNVVVAVCRMRWTFYCLH